MAISRHFAQKKVKSQNYDDYTLQFGMNQRENYFNSVYMYRQIATSNEPGNTDIFLCILIL